MSRHLGHKSMATTLASYLGTETLAVSRSFNRMLGEARRNPSAVED